MTNPLNILPSEWREETDLTKLNEYKDGVDVYRDFPEPSTSVDDAKWIIQDIIGPPPTEPRP